MPRHGAPVRVTFEEALAFSVLRLRGLAAVGCAFEAEQIASDVLGSWRAGCWSPPSSVRRYELTLAQELAAYGDGASVAALRALACVCPDGPFGEAADRLDDRAEPTTVPRWTGDLGRARALRAGSHRLRERRADTSTLAIEFSHVDGPRHVVLALVDHRRRHAARSLLLLDARVWAELDGLVEREPHEVAGEMRAGLSAVGGMRGVDMMLWYVRGLAEARLAAITGGPAAQQRPRAPGRTS